MSELHAQVSKRPFQVFSTLEMTEFIQTSYAFLGIAFRDKCSMVSLDRTQLSRLRNGEIVGYFPMRYDSDSIFDVMRSTLLKILDRDNLLKNHVRIPIPLLI